MTKGIIGFVNQKTIKLSDIVEMIKEASEEDNDQDSEGEITVIVEVDEKHRWTEVWLDLDKDTEKHNCGIKFIISDTRKKIFSFKSSSYLSKLGPVTPSKITQLSNIEHKIFRLYSAQVEVEVDEARVNDESYLDTVRNEAVTDAAANISWRDGIVTDCEDFPELGE